MRWTTWGTANQPFPFPMQKVVHLMKYLAFAVAIIFLFCVLWTSSVVHDAGVTGTLKISAHGLRTVFMTTPGESCDCCPHLWNGGIAYAFESLSPVQVGDMADVTTLDGGHYVLECAEIVPCLRVGGYLVGWRGVVKVNGDIIMFSEGRAYRFIRI